MKPFPSPALSPAPSLAPPIESLAKPSSLEVASESIVVRIRWFGLILGGIVANLPDRQWSERMPLNAILLLGLCYTLIDTWFSWKGRVFLDNNPLVISLAESLFIGLLCHFDNGPESIFRNYYLLSLLCCSLRHSTLASTMCCIFHWISFITLLAFHPNQYGMVSLLTPVILGWMTWASQSLVGILRQAREGLVLLNEALRASQTELENRIEERTQQLQSTQALVLQQEKMAGFGLIAAGVAHEVGNPLTGISSIVQILQKRQLDDYTRDKLELISGQLTRIRSTLRELLEFSRPAARSPIRTTVRDILQEALNIAKYYKRTQGKIVIPPEVEQVPPFVANRDELVQVFLNILLNAIDASGPEGHVRLEFARDDHGALISVVDNGPGVSADFLPKLFSPHATTKRHGTGLGLFISRKVMLEQGGGLDYLHQPGGGARFIVKIPLPRQTGEKANHGS